MATKLTTFDFDKPSHLTTASDDKQAYPWAEWFDGDIWELTYREDFDPHPLMMERIIRTRASNKNHKAKVTMRHLPPGPLNGEDAAIVLQRTDIVGPSEQKKIDSAKRRAEKKAAATAEATKTLAAAGMTPKKVNGHANGVKRVSKRPAKKAPARV